MKPESQFSTNPSSPVSLTVSFVAQALGLPQRDLQAFTQITTDSRKIQPGCLFVAITGEKFDGHDFIPQAIQAGARGVICSRGVKEAMQGVQIFTVPNTVEAYRKLAHAWRRNFRIPVVAVAGSVGKTTSKEILAAILRGRYDSVLKTQGSQNGFVGIPMTLLELRPEHGAAVIEVGIDEIGAMKQHMELVQADGAILTAIGPEHLEKLVDIETVAREEAIALEATAARGGFVAINLDDPYIAPLARTVPEGAKKIRYTLKPASAEDSTTLKGSLSPDGTEITLSGAGFREQKLVLPLLGKHNALNFLGAVAVALGLGLTAREIEAGLKTFRGADGRSELRELSGQTLVVCDYYNANPTSVNAGLELLTQVSKQGGRSRTRWACLGDMLELGPDEERYHRDLADKLLELKIENVLLYGPRMKALANELTKRGFSGRASHYSQHDELAASLLERMSPGDAVLIKGSRGMRMENVWKQVEARFAQGKT